MAQRIRPFAGERWWVVALPSAFTVALAAVAVVLLSPGAIMAPDCSQPGRVRPLRATPLVVRGDRRGGCSAHTPQLSAAEVAFAPLVVLFVAALALVLVGMRGLSRRDISI